MATTAYGVNHPLAVKLWRKKLMREALKETFMQRFMGSDKGSLLYNMDDLKKSAGDRVRVGLRMQLSGAGVAGDGTLEGNEEALVTYTDDLLIDQLRHAVRSSGKASEQRIAFSVREEAHDGLRDWWADRYDTAFFNHLTGNTAVTDLKYVGQNATVAPSTGTADGVNRIIYGSPDNTADSEASLSSSASGSSNFQLTYLDVAINRAQSAAPLIRPVRTPAGPKYVVFLHQNQVYSLRTDATAARVTWYDTNRALVEGGDKNNGIFTGALGEYNGVVLHKSTRIPLAPNTTTVRRAVFCGAQAACFATGRDNGAGGMSWVEEMFDYGNQLGVSAGSIFGMKKLVYNGQDFATIVISTHAETP